MTEQTEIDFGDSGAKKPRTQPRTIGEAVRHIREDGKTATNRTTGTRFEKFVSEILPSLPEYEITEVHRFADWKERQELMNVDGKDLGIDLVGKTKNGGYVAIQCKIKDEKATISPNELGTFISSAAPTRSTGFQFQQLMLVCNCNITGNTATLLKGRDGLWVNLMIRHGSTPLNISEIKKKHTPNDKQQQAIDSCVKGFSQHKRGRLIMACGTGKTFTSLKIAEKLKPQPKRILFAAPSIALVAQARREWIRHSKADLDCMIVCSDATAGKSAKKEDGIELLLLDSPVTRNPKEIAKFLAQEDDATRVVFCTYHSLERVSEAQKKHKAPAFDLALIDEAHRTTGVEKNDPKDKWSFQDIHSDDNVRIDRRLYMTATQKIYTAASKSKINEQGVTVFDMSDESIYGPEFYRLKFRDAVDWRGKNGERMLCDYRVITLFMPSGMTDKMVGRLRNITDDKGRKIGEAVKDLRSHCLRVYGVALALNGEIIGRSADVPGPMSRAIGFCNTISNSKFYTGALNDPQLKAKVTRAIAGGKSNTASKMNAQHLDATSHALSRTESLMRLQNAGKDDCEILCNVNLFKEGVDVPSLDSVVFFEPRQSQVDVVQAVGRVMRYAKGKRYGYIIIPIPMEDSANLDEMIKNQEGFDAIGKVLRALQSHDERLKEDIARMVIPAAPKPPVTTTYDVGGGEASGDSEVAEPVIPGLLEFAQGLEEVTDDVLTQMLEKSGLSSTGRLNADEIENAVKAAAGLLYKADIARNIASVIGDDSYIHAEKKEEKEKLLKAECTIGALLLMNALLLHKRLAAGGGKSYLEGLSGFGALPKPMQHLQNEWLRILERDYKPVFEPALAVLRVLLKSSTDGYVDNLGRMALRRLVECVNNVADSLSELGYDHAGPLYHRILGSAESDGAFYTTNTAALLLAQLALPPDFTDWQDKAKVKKLRVMDPACGTGTLLMAALKTMKERVLSGAESSDKKHATLHKTLVENVFCGLDINHQAIQIAASNLTLRAPEVDYRRINLYTMKHGVDAKGAAHAGTLELLRGNDLPLLTQSIDSTISQRGGKKVDSDDTTDDFPVKNLDMVIMNPPYSNNTKRSAKLGDEAKALMQANEKSIKSAVSARMGQFAGDVIEFNSFSTFFTPLVDQLINKESGTLAMVIPVTVCTGHSGINQRRFIAENFHIERLIISHAKSGFNFSGNTDIHECLLIARRREGKHPPTEITVLQKMPQNAKEVYELVNAIQQKKLGDWGAQHKWDAKHMQAGDWSAVQWFSGELVQAAQSIKQNADLERLDENHKITVAGQSVRATFQTEKCAANEKGAAPLFYSKSAKLRNMIYAKTSEYAKPKNGKEQDAERLLSKGGHFLTATRADTHSGLITAIYSPQAAIGSGWLPVNTPNKKAAQALAVWWNSTPAWLQLLNIRGTKLTWPMWSINDLNGILIPQLSEENIATLVEAYEKVKKVQLCRMSHAAHDTDREIIDAAAAKVSGIPQDTIRHWRHLLAAEPTISN